MHRPRRRSKHQHQTVVLTGSEVEVRTTGAATVVGRRAYRVAVPQRISYVVQGAPVTEDGVSLFTVVRSDGALKIQQHFWWRPYQGVNPSLLWAG